MIDQWIGARLRSFYRKRIEQTTDDSGAIGLERPAVVFAPHQDDETLGCGGTILLKRKAGAEVKVVFMTDGRTSHSQFIPAEELIQMREREAAAACLKLRLAEEDIYFLRFPDSQLGSWHTQAVQRVTEILSKHPFTEIFLPYRADPQPDHSSTYQIVMTALQRNPIRGSVLEFPVWYWFHWPWVSTVQKANSHKKRLLKNTARAGLGLKVLSEFRCSVNIEPVLAEKYAALNQHRSQMTEVIPNAGWPTLHDVADGDFLDCFFQKKEIFRYSAR